AGLVPARDGWRGREVVVGVGAVVAAIAVVEGEGVERSAHEPAQHPRGGDDQHEGVLPAARPPTEEAIDEVGRDPESRLIPVDLREREPARIAPVGHVRVALPVHRAASSGRPTRYARVMGTGAPLTSGGPANARLRRGTPAPAPGLRTREEAGPPSPSPAHAGSSLPHA